MSPRTAGPIGASAGDLSGEPAGVLTLASAGDLSSGLPGDPNGHLSGDLAGDLASDLAGDMAGERSGGLSGVLSDAGFVAEALTQVELPGQLVVLALMLGCGAWSALRPGALPLTCLAACAALWLRANSRLEGAVLLDLAPGRGLTLADLLVPALGCLVLLRPHLALRRRHDAVPPPQARGPAGDGRAGGL